MFIQFHNQNANITPYTENAFQSMSAIKIASFWRLNVLGGSHVVVQRIKSKQCEFCSRKTRQVANL